MSGLLLLPLAPVRGTLWVADHLLAEARRQATDPRAVQARLAALNRDLEEGTLDEAAFEREEERLLALLEARSRPCAPARPGGVGGGRSAVGAGGQAAPRAGGRPGARGPAQAGGRPGVRAAAQPGDRPGGRPRRTP